MLSHAETKTRGSATAEQRTELRRLIAERNVRPAWLKPFYRDVRRAEGLSAGAASDALIYLRSLAPKGDEPTHATPAQAEALRGLARSRVIPGKLRTIWLSQLDTGQLTYQLADRTICEWLRQPHRVWLGSEDLLAPAAAKTPDGYFALIREDDGKPRCFRVHTSPLDNRRIVEQITGEAPHQRRTLRGPDALHVLGAVADDIAAAAARYGTMRRRCSNCNQPLRRTDQPGYPHGYGDDCWTQLQKPTDTETRP